MNYQIIQRPFTLAFRDMSKKELKEYNEWFHKIIPERIQILTSAIKTTPGYENWEPDCSPESLEPLGEWFLSHVEMRPRTQEEIEEIQSRSRSKFPIYTSGNELTNKTISLAMDIGMYVSQVFLKNHPELQWSQPFGSKNFVDYGRPVLISFTSAPFNPVRMMVTLAYCFSDKSKLGDRLRELYNIWSAMIKST